ncbi:LINS family protein [Megaselia abdita]
MQTEQKEFHEMVLRKDRATIMSSSVSSSSVSVSNEQPVPKKQRIDTTTTSIPGNLDSIDSERLDVSEPPDVIVKSEPQSSDEVDKSLPSTSSPITAGTVPDLVKTNHPPDEMGDFEECLLKQCLCSVSETTLSKPFENLRQLEGLKDWPVDKLIQFLSNIQLLFDVYLKQNSKGFICSTIMDVCEFLVQKNHKLIDEIIDLSNSKSKYVQFVSARVLASFLVITKNDLLDDKWLKKLVDNLFSFERLDALAIQKMCFSQEIIRRIVEWRDTDLHPLEDEAEGNAGIPIENNPFATGLPEEENNHRNQSVEESNGTCQIVTLTDAESFDTTQLKCQTIKILENKWPALVRNMKNLISGGHLNGSSTSSAENCILTFLQLWENIISVKTNLSIVDILPFYSQLDTFEELLHQNNFSSCTVYKQMLSLFNEALCYGSTLALQDSSPEQLCLLAQQVVRHVNHRLLEYLPRRQPENCVGLLGFKGTNRDYSPGDIADLMFPQIGIPGELDLEMDKTILQKMFLLVLKSVAVTVKEIRSDSSDSSIDSQDNDADQEMRVIERSMRNALRKLENFIKNTLQFHPDSHFSKILIHLLNDQDDYLIEAMVCALDVTHVFSFRNNSFPQLVAMLNPVYTFLEFLNTISNDYQIVLEFLVSNETCFLLYLLRFLRFIRSNWSMFINSCQTFESNAGANENGNNTLDRAMGVLINLRFQINRLVSRNLFPYDISPIVRLIENCESLYENDDLS